MLDPPLNVMGLFPPYNYVDPADNYKFKVKTLEQGVKYVQSEQ